MAKLGSFNFDDFKRLQKNIQDIEKSYPGFVEECVKEIAGRIFAKTVARTPVGVYPNKQGGTLRRGWTIGPVQREPNGSYLVEIINPVEYSLYVEYGHRTANHMGWVEGRFMLTISIKEIEAELPSILNRKLQQFINRHMR
jgi:hypothetical protein